MAMVYLVGVVSDGKTPAQEAALAVPDAQSSQRSL